MTPAETRTAAHKDFSEKADHVFDALNEIIGLADDFIDDYADDCPLRLIDKATVDRNEELKHAANELVACLALTREHIHQITRHPRKK
jgi:hypothetical protein